MQWVSSMIQQQPPQQQQHHLRLASRLNPNGPRLPLNRNLDRHRRPRKRRSKVLKRRHMQRSHLNQRINNKSHQNRLRQLTAAPNHTLLRIQKCRRNKLSTCSRQPMLHRVQALQHLRMNRPPSTVIRFKHRKQRTMATVRIVEYRNRNGCRWKLNCRRPAVASRHASATIM